MGLLHESYREEGPQASLDMRSMTASSFKPYVYPDVVVSLSIGDYRFEKEISESHKVLNQMVNGKKYDHVFSMKVSAYGVPEYLLEGVSRDVFVEKWKWRVGDPAEGTSVTFVPQDDGSYAASGNFLDEVSDLVKRCKKR